MTPLVLLLLAAPAGALPGPADAPVPPTRYEDGPGAQAATPPTPPSESFQRRLIALELALSATVVQRPTLWRFEGLEAEASALMAVATDESQRAAVREVADRLDRFATIAARSRQQRSVANGWRSPSTGAVASRSVAPPVRRTKAGPAMTAGGYDAQGVLRPVVSKRPGAPKYAVVDDRGRLAALVTPLPELAERFDDLIGKRVGLSGERGFLTDLRRDHVVAERVTALPTLRR